VVIHASEEGAQVNVTSTDELGQQAVHVVATIGCILHAFLIGAALLLGSSVATDFPTLEELCSAAFACCAPLTDALHRLSLLWKNHKTDRRGS
jgi:hypothetical protein